MRNELYNCLVILALLFAIPISAQTNQSKTDTTVADSSFLFRFHQHELLNDTFESFNPLIFRNTHRYLETSSGLPVLGVGNPGHAIYSPVFSMEKNQSLNRNLFPAFYPYLRQPDNVQYYNNQPPVTDLFYMTGAKEEELFNLMHARNFGSQLNMSIHINRQASTGFYNHLRTVGAYFDINAHYKTVNERYTLLTNYIYNKKTLEENGGYENFALIENPETAQSTRLDFASNVLREEGVTFEQSLGIGKVGMKDEHAVIPLFRLKHNFQFTGGYRYYSDLGADENGGNLDTSVYDQFVFDSTFTADSIVYTSLRNQIGLAVYPLGTAVTAYYRIENEGYDQNHLVDTIYSNHYTGVEIQTRNNRKLSLKAFAEYGLDGFESNNFRSDMRLTKRRMDSSSFFNWHVGIALAHEVPGFYYRNYRSNNVNWSNSFEPIGKRRLYFNAVIWDLHLSGESGNISNYVYFDQNRRPAQYNSDISYFNIGLSKLLNWKRFFLESRLRYQEFSNSNLIPLPNLMAWESAYVQGTVFNKVLKFQLGLDVYWYSSHFAYGYAPETGQFYLQDETKLGDYPYVDVFLNANLKRAFFFLKMSHFNKGMSGEDYFQVPDYPVASRSFKFGIRWILYE